MTTLAQSIVDLSECCDALYAAGVPHCVYIDGQEEYHWHATRTEMEAFLCRPLSDIEVTCLSVSRWYGPMPCLSAWQGDLGELRDSLGFVVSLDRHGAYDWSRLAELLRRFLFGEAHVSHNQ
jgi:hypothetical protein